uniref:Uncharacterized protein n=1 Tax=Eutreptiella gymnastica TaxID=73025 RepID=A0A7S4D4S2_9EUGL
MGSLHVSQRNMRRRAASQAQSPTAMLNFSTRSAGAPLAARLALPSRGFVHGSGSRSWGRDSGLTAAVQLRRLVNFGEGGMGPLISRHPRGAGAWPHGVGG